MERGSVNEPVVFGGVDMRRQERVMARGVDILVWALIWVNVVGLGPFAGMLAIMTSDLGAFGKLYSEAIEAADRGLSVALIERDRGAGLLEAVPHASLHDGRPERQAAGGGTHGDRRRVRIDGRAIQDLGEDQLSRLRRDGIGFVFQHFDQIAGWDRAQVLWMENHVFARGRIGRENWQQQAKDLAAATPS